IVRDALRAMGVPAAVMFHSTSATSAPIVAGPPAPRRSDGDGAASVIGSAAQPPETTATATAKAVATAERDLIFREVERKRGAAEFDVFLCHNSADKPEVARIADRLEQHGILPWLDERELPPGQPWQVLLEKQIANIKAAAVFVGP